MARALAIVLLALCASASIAAAATSPTPAVVPKVYTKTYADFYMAVVNTPQATLCKQILDSLNLKTTMSNPKLALTIFVPSDDAFTSLASKMKLSTTSLTSSMNKNAGLMRQIMFYHFVTGSAGTKGAFPTWALKPGMKLDTMYTSAITKAPYQLSVSAVTGSKVLIKSVGTSAYTFLPNIKCGAGVAHGIDNMLLPMSLTTIAKYVSPSPAAQPVASPAAKPASPSPAAKPASPSPKPAAKPVVKPASPSPKSAAKPAVKPALPSRKPVVKPASPYPAAKPASPSPKPAAKPASPSPKPAAKPASPSPKPAAKPASPSPMPVVKPASPSPAAKPASPSPKPAAKPASPSPKPAAKPVVKPALRSPKPAAKPASPSPKPAVKPASPSPKPAVKPASPSPKPAVTPASPSPAAKPASPSPAAKPASPLPAAKPASPSPKAVSPSPAAKPVAPSPAVPVPPKPTTPEVVPQVYTKTYADFYTAVVNTPQATLCKQILDSLNLKTTMSNPKLALTILVPSDTAFTSLATKLKLSTDTMTSSMNKNAGLMRQIMFYHFVTGSAGTKGAFPTWALKPGMKLDTMYTSAITNAPCQLSVSAVTGSKVLIKSVGTSAYTFLPNIKCGAGVAHGIDNMLLPMSLDTIAKYV
ncbi:MAG: hypothetical protein J3K34DRAFT_163369 [Monoraphidium minutum]|nr:MAG: hypothetical protein J3K34DRAFT_163369 [Monoraphidium minutum]